MTMEQNPSLPNFKNFFNHVEFDLNWPLSKTFKLTRFAWWQQDLHAIELLRAHIGEWTMTRMLDYW
jgi:hypothetical protein